MKRLLFVLVGIVWLTACGSDSKDATGNLGQPCGAGCKSGLVCVNNTCRPTEDGDTIPDGDKSEEADKPVDGDSEIDVIVDGDHENTPTDGDAQPDGDTAPDGDQESAPDGDATPDGDAPAEMEADGDDVPQFGSISGSIYSSQALDAFTRTVSIYDQNPFTVKNLTPIKTFSLSPHTGGIGTYQFTDLPQGRYFLMVRADVGENDDLDDDISAVYPDKVAVVPSDPNSRNLTGIDMYLDVQNPSWGSLGGTLYVHEKFQGQRITVVASQELPNVNGNPTGEEQTRLQVWPSCMGIVDTVEGQGTYDFSCGNLTSGTYYLVALIDMEGVDLGLDGDADTNNTAPWAVAYPHGSFEIDVDVVAKRSYQGIDFYLGAKDPRLGSISGKVAVSASVPGGTLGVYLFRTEGKEAKPVSATIVEKNDVDKVYDYQVVNLFPNIEFWVAGFYLDKKDDKDRVAVEFLPDKYMLDFSIPSKKDLTGLNMTIPVTELSGKVTVKNAPGGFEKMRILLVRFELDGLTLKVAELGGGTDGAQLGPVSNSKREADYVIYPARGGEWTPVVVLDVDNNGLDGKDRWCYEMTALIPKTFQLNGSQLTATKDVSLDYNWCYNPPE